MSVSLLAFIESKKHLAKALELANRDGVKTLTIVSEDLLIVPEDVFRGEISTVLFGDHRPDDLDELVMEKIEKFLNDLFNKNPALKASFEWDGNDLTRCMTYPFSDEIQHCLRKAIIMEIIAGEYEHGMVYMDDYWMRYAGLTELNVTNVTGGIAKCVWRMRRKWNLLMGIFTGMIFKLLIPMLVGKLMALKKKDLLRNKKILLIGLLRQNRSTYKVWNRIKERCSDTAELISNWKLNWKDLWEITSSEDKCLLISSVSTKDIPRIILRYLKMCLSYINSNIGMPFSTENNRHNHFRLLLDKFMTVNATDALAVASVRQEFAKLENLETILLSVPASWCTILSSMMESDVQTVAFTHGMALSPIGYRSNHSLKVTHTAFDTGVMSRCSDDKDYIPWNVIPDEARNIVDDKDHLRERLKRVGRGGPDCDKDAILEGRNAAILASSNIKSAFMRKYLKGGIEYFTANRHKYRHDYIAVKIHPNSDIDEFERYLEEITKNMPGTTVYLSRDVNVKKLFAYSVFAVTMPSSIMLDLLLMNVPFSVFTRGTMVDNSLIKEFKNWMRFKRFEDLDEIRVEDLQEFTTTAAELRELCWEYEGRKGYTSDELAEMLVGQRRTGEKSKVEGLKSDDLEIAGKKTGNIL